MALNTKMIPEGLGGENGIGQPFDEILQILKQAKITKIDIGDSLIVVFYLLNDKPKQIFITHSILLAACVYVQPLFKIPSESLSGSHTYDKNHQ